MKLLTASFFRGGTELLNRQEVRFEEISEPVTGETTWFGEFYLNKQPSFESEILKMVLEDGRSQEIKVIVSNFMQNFYFVSFRSLLMHSEEAAAEQPQRCQTGEF